MQIYSVILRPDAGHHLAKKIDANDKVPVIPLQVESRPAVEKLINHNLPSTPDIGILVDLLA